MLTASEQKKAAKAFAEKWKGRGYEKGETQRFWFELLQTVYGVENPSDYMNCEVQVQLEHTSFIDIYLPETKVMIEQKSLGKDLSKPIKQSDGSMLNPLQQLKRYAAALGYYHYPRWGVTCNFAEFYIYDMGQPNGEPSILKLENLPEEYYRLNFLVDTGDDHIKKELKVSLEAGALVGRMYESLLTQYGTNPTEEMLQSLNMLIVRIVFLLYAEDAGILGHHSMFHDYMADYKPHQFRRALLDLFEVLDTPDEERDPFMEENLAKFPYVNGGLFTSSDKMIIPQFGEDCVSLIVNTACAFDWSGISPTIFGAVFESTLSAKVRRSGGMHYTSLENIHKVIDPLFLNDLKAEYENILEVQQANKQRKLLEDFQEKLAGLTFFDPACGSGNFLTETYISLRRLENQVIDKLTKGQVLLGLEMADPVKVSIQQFYGIEINDFACVVAKTAMWIAELQMLEETKVIINRDIDLLPLKTYVNIVEGNALRLDWEEVVPKDKCSYIMGNPPFVGYSLQSKEQKADMLSIYVDEKGKPYKTAGKVDYVAGWYFKASQYMENTVVRTAFVSTNSITQGEQVAAVWKPLYDRFGIHIDFAWRTFIWNSESTNQAHVHCVIVGFSQAENTKNPAIYNGTGAKISANINPYLLPVKNIFIESRSVALCDAPEICSGFKAADNGFLILNEAEKSELLNKEPAAQPWIRPYSMGVEFINKIPRYCLWLKDASPKQIANMSEVRKRVVACKEWRENATKTGDAYKLRDIPHLFRPCKQFKDGTYIAIPLVSSSNRRYVPMGFADNGMIPGNNLFCVFGAELYHFGVLMSNVHMSWIRAVGGFLKSDWRYSKNIVYNNFPWPTPTEAQREKIEKTAQGILDARAQYPDSSLADLYDEVLMPVELRRAHQANDRAVMEAYGFWGVLNTESQCVAKLMEMYQQLTTK